MSRIGKAWATAAIPVAGAALSHLHAPSGVAVSFVGLFLATMTVFNFNVAATRLPQRLAVLLNAWAIYQASGAPLLSLGAILIGVNLVPTELVLRRWRDLHDYQAAVGLILALPIIGMGLPDDWSGAAVAPNVLVGILVTLFGLWGRSKAGTAAGRHKLKLGDPMEEIELPYRDGQGSFSLSAQRGSFVLMVFVRGDWCPVCHVMMRVINSEREALARHGVKLFLVTPSEGAVDEEFATSLGIETHMLLDRGAARAASLGLLDLGKREGADVPLPVSLLVDPDGVLRDITRPDDVTHYSSDAKIRRALEAHAAPGPPEPRRR